MVEQGGGAGLSAKALESNAVAGEAFRNKLDGDCTAELEVFGLVDHSHAAHSQLFQNAIVGNGLADHGLCPPRGAALDVRAHAKAKSIQRGNRLLLERLLR